MDIDRAPFIYKQLQHAQTGLVLTNELHLLYLVTPLDQVDGVYLKWMLYYNQVHSWNYFTPKFNKHPNPDISNLSAGDIELFDIFKFFSWYPVCWRYRGLPVYFPRQDNEDLHYF